MIKNRTLEKILRFFLTLLGAGLGAGAAALMLPILQRRYDAFANTLRWPVLLYTVLSLLGALVFFLLSSFLVRRTLHFISATERSFEKMSLQQLFFLGAGLVIGLIIAALISQLILSMGASLVTISASALIYVVFGYLGMHIGFRRARAGRLFNRRKGAAADVEDLLSAEEEGAETPAPTLPRKYLDTSVIIDGRILDIVKTGFLEGEVVIPQFVLAELRHIADSGDSLRRARGRRGLDVLQKMQKETTVTVVDTDYPDLAEVDVKLLRLCKEENGTVVTNDYNLNKVAGVTGIRVLNINDLANAVKPMLMAGEEMTVQIVREGKEPGQGVAYLDDGTMIVVENGRRHVGETVAVVVTTVLQTSAGRMIFTKLAAQGENRTAV